MVLVTGCSSFLGNQLVNRLLEEGEKIRCIDIEKPKDLNPKVEYVTGDFLDEKVLQKACKGVDSVFHFLNIKSTTHYKRRFMKKINVTGTKKLLDIAEQSGVKKFFYLSSFEVYGRRKKIPIRQDDIRKPKTKYGKDKLKGESFCWEKVKKDTMAVTLFRPALIAGPKINNPVILISLLMALGMEEDNRMYISGDGDTRFQLLHPEDALDAFILSFKNDISKSKVYNLGSDNVPTQMEQLVKTKECAQLDCTIKHLSPFKTRVMSILLRPFKINYLTKRHVNFLLNNMLLDCQRAKKDLGWNPTKDNIDIVLETIDWYKTEKL